MDKLNKQKINIKEMSADQLKQEVSYCTEILNRYDYYTKISGNPVKKRIKIQDRLEHCLKVLKRKGEKC